MTGYGFTSATRPAATYIYPFAMGNIEVKYEPKNTRSKRYAFIIESHAQKKYGEGSGISLYRVSLLVIQRKTMENALIQIGFEEDTIMCQDCKDAVASHRGRHYDTELCADCFYERYD